MNSSTLSDRQSPGSGCHPPWKSITVPTAATPSPRQDVGGGANRAILPSYGVRSWGAGLPATTRPLSGVAGRVHHLDEVGHDLPKLLAAGRARAVLDQLPELDPVALPDEAVPRAMLLLSFLGHAYVWESWRQAPAERLPPAVARPWAKVARRLGRPPVLSYASYALDNWRRLDPGQPIAVGNLALLQNFLGGLDEEWFVTIHIQIEQEAAPALAALPATQAALAREDAPGQVRALTTVASAIKRMHHTLQRMPENCDPYIYYSRVRHFIHGWQQHPVIYDGVSEYRGVPQGYYGETGAQSTIVPCLDTVLGVAHQPDELRVYLAGMRTYMPPAHVAFLEQLEAGPSVRDFVLRSGDRELREVYDTCVAELAAFRSTHLEYAARYIQNQAQVGANSNLYGTGGTPFMRYLSKHRDETAGHRVPVS
jgi:indoleamine 2,3-dioxygenase